MCKKMSAGQPHWKKKMGRFKVSGVLLKLFLLLMFIVCAVLAVYQSTKSIIRYKQKRIVTSVSERNLNHEEYPYIVVCGDQIVKRLTENMSYPGEEFSTLFSSSPDSQKTENYPWSNVSLEKYKDSLNNISLEVLAMGGETTSDSASGSTIYITHGGMCPFIRPWEREKKPKTIHIKLKEEGRYRVALVQNLEELFNIGYTDDMRNEFVTAGLAANKGYEVYKLSVKKKTTISTKEFACSKKGSYVKAKCFDKCIADHLLQAKLINCTLPWTKSRINAPDCDNNEDFKAFAKYIFADDDKDAVKRREGCLKRCPDACTTFLYTLEEAVTGEVPEEKYTVVIMVDHTLKIVDEFVAYEFMNVVGDVGGIVGILLGFSVFGILQMLVSYLQRKTTNNVTVE